MLNVIIPGAESWDAEKEEFVYAKDRQFQIEHSLVSISKWESKWQKPFLGTDQKTDEETVDYIRCMTITQKVDPDLYRALPPETIQSIQEYIASPMTATWFNERKGPVGPKEVITSEVIYYWMIAQNIPMECQKWHLNRLLTLIRVCNIKSNPKQNKRGKKEMLAERRALNEARKAELSTKG